MAKTDRSIMDAFGVRPDSVSRQLAILGLQLLKVYPTEQSFRLMHEGLFLDAKVKESSNG